MNLLCACLAISGALSTPRKAAPKMFFMRTRLTVPGSVLAAPGFLVCHVDYSWMDHPSGFGSRGRGSPGDLLGTHGSQHIGRDGPGSSDGLTA